MRLVTIMCLLLFGGFDGPAAFSDSSRPADLDAQPWVYLDGQGRP